MINKLSQKKKRGVEMKRILMILLVMSLMVVLSACDSGDDENDKNGYNPYFENQNVVIISEVLDY